MSLKNLIMSEEDFRAQVRLQRLTAQRYERVLRDIAAAKAAPADRLREMAAKAVRKRHPIKPLGKAAAPCRARPSPCA